MQKTLPLSWIKPNKLFGKIRYIINEDIKIDCINLTIEKGFESDGTTVPPIFKVFVDPMGIQLIAAISHDKELKLIEHLMDIDFDEYIDKRRDAAKKFLIVMINEDVPKWYATILFEFVRLRDNYVVLKHHLKRILRKLK